MKKKQRVALSVGLLAVIVAMLVVILVVLPEPSEEDSAPPSAPGDVADEPTDAAEPETMEQMPLEEAAPAPEPVARPVREVYIVIDDVGNSLAHLEPFLDLPVDVTFALLPGRPHTEESARRIERAGFDMILHQPMEPEGGQDPGSGAILTTMTPAEIQATLRRNLVGLPPVAGINNHMGSKATSDAATMKAVMTYLKSNSMFFLDSVTTDRSVAAEAARVQDVQYTSRSALFLDNNGDKPHVEKAFEAGISIAAATGESVMIGHLKTAALAEVIREKYKSLAEDGFAFRGMSDYFPKSE